MLGANVSAQTAPSAPAQLLRFERVLVIGERPAPVEVIELPRVVVIGRRAPRRLADQGAAPKAKG